MKRREFLQGIGVTSAAALLTGCASSESSDTSIPENNEDQFRKASYNDLVFEPEQYLSPVNDTHDSLTSPPPIKIEEPIAVDFLGPEAYHIELGDGTEITHLLEYGTSKKVSEDFCGDYTLKAVETQNNPQIAQTIGREDLMNEECLSEPLYVEGYLGLAEGASSIDGNIEGYRFLVTNAETQAGTDW